MSKDYYNILGVEKEASKDEIKKAFRKLAHQYHPDKKEGDEAKFKEVNEAYQVLGNEQKRAQYDQFGSGFSSMGGGQSHGGFEGFGGFGGQGMEFDFGNLNDIFSDFFTGGHTSGRSAQTRRGRDISTEIQIPFSESIFGTTRKILITKQSVCLTCKGSGAAEGSGMETCSHCNGQGKVHEAKRTILGTISTARVCDTCLGGGKVPEKICKDCSGKGVLRREEEVSVQIPAGIRDGEMIRMSSMGEAVSKGTTGDLYIKINVVPHKIFRREGENLAMTLDLKLTDALLGAKYPIETLDGKIEVKVPEGVGINEVLRVKGKGVPTGGRGRGDLMIKLKIKLPKKLSKKEKKIIEDLQKEGI